MNEEQKTGEVAFEIHQKILEQEKARRALLLSNMKLVAEMHDSKMYKSVLGDEDADWPAYLADVGLFYSRAKVRRWKRIFEWLDFYKIDANVIFTIPESRLEQLVLASKNTLKGKDEALELLSYAETMLPRDWKNETLKLRGKQTTDDHEHTFKKYEICPDCGEKRKINNDEDGKSKTV